MQNAKKIPYGIAAVLIEEAGLFHYMKNCIAAFNSQPLQRLHQSAPTDCYFLFARQNELMLRYKKTSVMAA